MKKKSKAGLIYFLIWVLTVGAFWLGLGRDAMGYSLLAFYAVLPWAGLLCPIFIAIRRFGFFGSIFGSLLIGFSYSAAQYLTFSLANMIMISFERINPFSVEAMIGGAATAFIGFLIGGIIGAVKRARG